ncbi:MAG: ABC transporter permease [Pikeienuella sp.]
MRAIRILYAFLAMIFLIAPLLVILPLAFTSSAFLSYPIPSWSFRWFEELAVSEMWSRSIINSLIIASGATALAVLLGSAAALGLRARNLPFRNMMRTAFMLPMVAPAVVLGVGMQVLFVRLGLASSYVGVIAAHTVLAIPFVVISVGGALAGIDPRVERAGASLGASPARVFLRVTLPLSMSGVLSGAALAFAISLDEVVLTLFVAGPNQRTLARQMFSNLRENIGPEIAAAAFVIIVGTLVVAGAMLLGQRRIARLRGGPPE